MENKNEFYLKLFCIGIFMNGAVITFDNFLFPLPLWIAFPVGGIGTIMTLVAAFYLVKLKK